MGLCTDLGLDVPRQNAFHRFMWKISGSRPGAWVFSKTLHHIDRVLFRLSGGRLAVPQLLAGLPVVMLTCIGAKTGQRRTLPLVAVPDEEDIVLIGTSFGQRHTPGWAFNLAADPAAEVSFRGRSLLVKARELEGDEREAAWNAGRRVYGGYEVYARRIAGRPIRIFRLELT